MPFSSTTLRGLGLVAAALSSFAAAKPCPSKPATVRVDTNVRYQELDGFGASEAFQRAEDVFGKGGLSQKNTDHVLDLLYSVEKGAGFAILRNGIGSSNTSDSNFMNSIEPFSPGSPHARPHYRWDHNNSGQFPLAQQAYARGLQTLYADAWSAPGYMKTNDDENNGGYLCGVTNTSCATGNWMQAYANYLVQYARFYRESGVRVTNIGFLNEPQFAATYAGMLSDGTQAADFIRVLARTIRESGMDLDINCCDGIGWQDQEAMMAGLQAGPDPAEQYLSVVTGHGYDSPPNFPLSTKKKTWLSEWADLSGQVTPWTFYSDLNGPGEGLTWARNIQVALVDAHVSGFIYWEGAEAALSNSALINLVGDVVYPTKRFWVMAQFSKFARPGARRVEASSSEAPLTVSSFLNLDGRLATQMVNNATSAYEIALKVEGHKVGHMELYLTNNEHNLTALEPVRAAADGSFKASIPGRSMVTFISS